MHCHVLVFIAVTLHCAVTHGVEGFPFQVPFDGLAAGSAPADLARPPRPAGAGGYVGVLGERFILRDSGQRIRFWGTNLCFAGCFPPHEVAERMARRLSTLGINCVRFHHMDSAGYPRGIWDAEGGWGDFEHKGLHPEALERLDYLVAQLKRRGIYTNLNLHVSRTYGPADGWPAVEQGQSVPRYGKGVDHFYPKCIAEQKRYARMLLRHENAYTGNPYAEEPAVAMVEISNEDGLVRSWLNGHLEDLPGEYKRELARQWNEWLAQRYGDTASLESAWAEGAMPGSERDLLAVGQVQGRLGAHQGARAALSECVADDGAPARRITVLNATATSWHVQHAWAPIALVEGAPYVLRIRLRANRSEQVNINCMMNGEPWSNLGLSRQVDVGPQWREHELSFRATATIAPQDGAGGARITLSGLSQPGLVVEFTPPTLRRAAVSGLPQGQRLGFVIWPGRNLARRTGAFARDAARFMRDTEVAYWGEMRRYLHQELGVRMPVTGTAVGFTTPLIAAETADFVDAHAYWCHPHFPGRPWDRNNWIVRQRPMVNSRGASTIASLAGRRVFGMPFTVTEYNHPQPQRYNAEGFPLIAAYGALQGWDGVFQFAYCHDGTWETDHFSSFFDMKADPVKLALMPACSALLRAGLIPQAAPAVGGARSVPQELQRLSRAEFSGCTAYGAGVPDDGWLRARVGVGRPSASGEAEGQVPLLWPAEGERRSVSIESPRCAGLIGFCAGQRVTVGDVRLSVNAAGDDGFAVALLTPVDGQVLGEAGRHLLTAVSRCHNRKMGWNAERNSVGSRWGEGPTLCEGVDLTLTARAEDAKVYVLDPDGSRRDRLEASATGGGSAMFRLGPEHQTLWYELVLR